MEKEPVKRSRIELKKDRTRQQIVDVAMALFHEKGFSSTTMEEVAEQADIAKKTLYNYFPEKEAILSTYMQRAMHEAVKQLDRMIAEHPDTQSCLSAFFEKAVAQTQAYQEIYRVYVAYRIKNLTNPHKHAESRSGLEELLTKILENGQQTGQIRRDIPALYLAKLLETSYSLILSSWVTNPEEFPLREGIGCCIELFLHGAVPQ